MADDEGLFNTPKLTYLSLKKNFLDRFMIKGAWGEFGSREQAVAVSGLLAYFEETRSLADQFPHLSSDITVENKNLVLEHILPFPPKLYEQLLLAAIGEGYQLAWQQPSSVILTRIEQFLVRMKSACLAAYEDKCWSEVNNFKNYTSDYDHTEDVSVVEVKTFEQANPITRAELRKQRN